MEPRQLFDKSPAELREAFVRNRFGEAAVFGLAEIETWFQPQRKAGRPDLEGWSQFLARDFTEMCAATMPLLHLQDRATRYTPFQQGTERSTAPFGRILPLFKDGFYWGYRDVGVYVHEPMMELFVLSEVHGKLTIERISDGNIYVGARAVVDVLFAEWYRQRPKWREAREFLCNVLAEEIKQERAKAEHDFDTAVAVSADGTKIVHADWVVVRDEDTNQRVRVFRSEQFRAKALRLDRHSAFARRESNVRELLKETVTPVTITETVTPTTITPEAIAVITRRAMWTPHTFGPWPMGLIDCDVNGQNVRIYYSITDLCPDPLPDGGMEVKVW